MNLGFTHNDVCVCFGNGERIYFNTVKSVKKIEGEDSYGTYCYGLKIMSPYYEPDIDEHKYRDKEVFSLHKDYRDKLFEDICLGMDFIEARAA